MNRVVFVQQIRREPELVRVRQLARDVAGLAGFDAHVQTRIATAASEIARNALRYAGGGDAEFSIRLAAPQAMCVRVVDTGPGIAHLDEVMGGRFVSPTGMGLGIVGTRRLVDEFGVSSTVGLGTDVAFAQHLPRTANVLTEADCDRIASTIRAAVAVDPFAELQRQNRELLASLEEVRRRQAELDRLNAELEDTNRGVMALYAELDDKAESLRRASEAKTGFLSNMTHEFRTPLNSVLSLSNMLLDRTDGELTPEQERQITYIRKSADDLVALVNDLLDLAKVEAGKVEVRPSDFEVVELFGGLKGVLRPLLLSSTVALHFDEPAGFPSLHTDEGKLSQILRNFISNALKYTERGEVRVWARYDTATEQATFSVADTGIGISPDDHIRIFEEFTQIDGPAQRRTKGTGLGLPLSRRLAELLGGFVALSSEVGAGSTFSVTVPVRFGGRAEPVVEADGEPRAPVVLLDDDETDLRTFSARLERDGFTVVVARSVAEARSAIAEATPAAILLEVLLETESAWPLLAELRADVATRDVPVIVITHVENRDKAMAEGADDFALKPVDPDWIVGRLAALTRARRRVLVVDDDEVSRYVLRDLLAESGCAIVEATGGAEGLVRARELRPDAIVLDLVMPDLSGEAVLAALRADEGTRGIPVVVYTSELLDEGRRAALAQHAVSVMNKQFASRKAAVAQMRAALESAGLVLDDLSEEVGRG